MPGKASPLRRIVKPLLHSSWVMLFALACASGPASQGPAPRNKLARADDFGALLVDAGLPTEDLPQGTELSAAQANDLRLRLSMDWPNRSEEAPRMVANLILRETINRKRGTVSRVEMSKWLLGFESLYMLRRDGCFARALSGKAEQCVGPVEVRDGSLRAGAFEVDHFYKRDARQQWKPAVTTLPTAPAG